MLASLKEWIEKILERQFGKPSGVLGMFWGTLMNRSNALMIRQCVDELISSSPSTALEIGFGGGRGLRVMLSCESVDLVIGVEASPTMIARARKSFCTDLEKKRLDLIHASVENMPLAANSVDGVVTINTHYFWPDLAQSFEEIYRVMAKGAIFVLGMRPKEKMQQLSFVGSGFKLYDVSELQRELLVAGFTEVSIKRHKDLSLGFFLLSATKPV